LPDLFSLEDTSTYKVNIPKSNNILVCPEENDFNTLAKFFMDIWFEKVNFILGFIVQRITFQNIDKIDPSTPLKLVFSLG
jgi:hypothetical protein